MTNFEKKRMKKILKAFVMRVGIDCLGFPLFVTHKTENYVGVSKYFKPYSK